MFFVFLKCTLQGGPKVDLLLIAFLQFWYTKSGSAE